EAAILAIVSPFFAFTFVRLEAFESVVVERRQFVRRTLLFGTNSLVAVLRSTPEFIVCKVATLTPVRLAIDCHSSPGATEITRAVSRLSLGTRLSNAANCFALPGGTRTV